MPPALTVQSADSSGHGRSHARILRSDLKRLARLARDDREDLFARHPEWSLLYRKRVLSVALCDDAALHFLNGVTGVLDFAVWTFYAEHPEAPFPHHRVTRADFGESRFGREPDAPQGYAGRRVLLTGRSLDASLNADPVTTLQHYLKTAATPSARQLAHKAVVLIAPDALLGLQIWPSLAL